MDNGQLYFRGKRINKLKREELVIALEVMYKEVERYRKLYFNTEKEKIQYMARIVK